MATFKDITLNNITGDKRNQCRKSKKYTDLVLRLNDGSEFHVHKIVLTSSCPYFERMFNSQMKESLMKTIDIKTEMKAKFFENLLEFIYSGKIELTEENATLLYEEAIFLELENLRKFTESYLVDIISKSVVICLDIWRFSKKFENYKMEMRCENFIADNTTEFIETCLEALAIQEVMFLVDIRNRLSCTQKYLFTKLIEWIKIDYTTRQFHIYALFNFIDFTEVPIDYGFLKVLEDKQLRNNKDFCQILTQRYKREVERYRATINIEKQELIFIISNKGLLKMDSISASTKYIYKKNFRFSSSFTTFDQSKSILVTAGINQVNCGYYSNYSKFYRKFPPLNESRGYHESIAMFDQIYLCGGLDTTSNHYMDIYDFNSDKWIKGSAPIEKTVDFGIIQWENSSIYTCGGFNNTSLSNIVERYDSREGKWYNLNKNSENLGLTKSICVNDQIYCFNEYGWNIYDIKMNEWIKGQQYGEWWRRFHITKLLNSIYAFGWKGSQILLPIAVRFDLINGNIENYTNLKINENFPYKRICQIVTLKD